MPSPRRLSGTRGRASAPRRLLLLLLAALLLASCAGRRPPLPTDDSDIRDVLTLPQLASAYLDPATADAGLVSPAVQAGLARSFATAWFSPWNATAPAHGAQDAFWGFAALAKGAWGPNRRQFPPGWMEAIQANAQPGTYPNLVQPAVAVRTTSLRVLPTDEPVFRDFASPGQGFPFDLNQNSLVWDQTPLLAAHASADGAWLLVESPTAAGWVPARDVALCDAGFIRLAASGRLAAVTREGTAVRDPYGRFRLMGRLGMVLPLIGGNAAGMDVLLADRDLHGAAAPLFARLPAAAAEVLPLPLTPRAVAGLADQLLGQPYGWGGLYADRDCSSTLQDLFVPFGLLLPRNSAAQARAGSTASLAGLSAAAKEAAIAAQGAPFLSLLHRPGHILLYLGQNEGRPVALHTLWGVRTTDFSGPTPGRKVVGRTVITTLAPGRELARFDPAGSLLEGLDRITLPLPPDLPDEP